MLKPLHNYVLLEKIEETNKTASGIYIPDTAKEKPSTGKVIAVGSGEINTEGKRRALDLKPGDKVLFAKWASSANEIKIDGKDYIIIKESDVLGVLD